jgi:hypothetical protein
MTVQAHIPGGPFQPWDPRGPGDPGREPWEPRGPRDPGTPLTPGRPPSPVPDPLAPTRVWLDPNADWQGRLYERLLGQRIVLASGLLDDDAAARLSAQLLERRNQRSGPRPARLLPAPFRLPERVLRSRRAEAGVRRHRDRDHRTGAAGDPHARHVVLQARRRDRPRSGRDPRRRAPRPFNDHRPGDRLRPDPGSGSFTVVRLTPKNCPLYTLALNR